VVAIYCELRIVVVMVVCIIFSFLPFVEAISLRDGGLVCGGLWCA